MTTARLDSSDGNVLQLSGELDFASVPVLWPELEQRLHAGPTLALSLQGVTRSNSAGLVLLLHALDVAGRCGCELAIQDVPPGLLDLARVSGCDRLLGA